MKSSPVSVVRVLLVLALCLMVGAFFSPIWWVSLTAPNYPKDRFPDGIKIHFGFSGVTNGCTTAAKTSRVAQETTQEDLGWREEGGALDGATRTAEGMGALDCVHEMNTINHYVGMRPIGVGAPVERHLSPYILGMFAVMLIAFGLRSSQGRLRFLLGGFFIVSAWMVVDLFGRGQLNQFVATYKEDAARYFNEAEKIAAWGETLRQAFVGVTLALVVIMACIAFASWKWPGFRLALGLIPAGLPLYFVLAYAAWLWFFGHSMHPWGAFTLKPFMPTVFGDGMVAQFTTHSYPHWGFGLLAAMFISLLVAVARLRLELSDHDQPPVAPSDGGA